MPTLKKLPCGDAAAMSIHTENSPAVKPVPPNTATNCVLPTLVVNDTGDTAEVVPEVLTVQVVAASSLTARTEIIGTRETPVMVKRAVGSRRATVGGENDVAEAVQTQAVRERERE